MNKYRRAMAQAGTTPQAAGVTRSPRLPRCVACSPAKPLVAVVCLSLVALGTQLGRHSCSSGTFPGWMQLSASMSTGAPEATAPLPFGALRSKWTAALQSATGLRGLASAKDASGASTGGSGNGEGEGGGGMIVFRYDYGVGGLGDCIKGLTAMRAAAHLAGVPFRVDFSRHPFGQALTFVDGVVAPPEVLAWRDDHPNVLHMGDWSSSPQRRRVRDAFFDRLRWGRIASDPVVVKNNLPMARELSVALGYDESRMEALIRQLYATLYSDVVDGGALAAAHGLWRSTPTPPLSALVPAGTGAQAFRAAVHLRLGDKFIDHATWNANDARVGDAHQLQAALEEIPALIARYAAAHQHWHGASARPLLFVAADTLHGRALIINATASSEIDVITSSEPPVHIGYSSTRDRPDATKEAAAVMAEHLALSQAHLLFIASDSGFSRTACLTTVVTGVAAADGSGAEPKVCLSRKGTEWVPYMGAGLVSL